MGSHFKRSDDNGDRASQYFRACRRGNYLANSFSSGIIIIDTVGPMSCLMSLLNKHGNFEICLPNLSCDILSCIQTLYFSMTYACILGT